MQAVQWDGGGVLSSAQRATIFATSERPAKLRVDSSARTDGGTVRAHGSAGAH